MLLSFWQKIPTLKKQNKNTAKQLIPYVKNFIYSIYLSVYKKNYFPKISF